MAREVKVNCASFAIFAILLLTLNLGCAEAKLKMRNNRKYTPSSGHVTKSYPTQSSAGNSHSDLAKSSYSVSNSALNRSVSAVGSGNTPKSQGYPASGTNVQTPMTATNTQSVQRSYAGTIYVTPGAPLPQGAVLYPSPPQFGAGLMGGVILHQVITSTQTRVKSAPIAHAGQPCSTDDKIIIINNGPPGSVTKTNAAGVTVITTGVVGKNATQSMPAPAPAAAPADSAIPNVPLAPIGDNNAAQPTPAPHAAPTESAPAAGRPPPGGIICVPVRVNDTNPADSSKMIEVEKIVCYPAPAPPPAPVTGAEINVTAPVMPPASKGSAPLAPMCPVHAASQQSQANPTRAPLLSDNASVKTSGAGAWLNYAACNSVIIVLLPLFIAFFGLH